MGCDIHIVLERKVRDAATINTQKTLSTITESRLPHDLMIHCAEQLTYTFEWLPVRHHEWLALSEEEFREKATAFYTIRAAALLFHVEKRGVARIEDKAEGQLTQELWWRVINSKWRQAPRFEIDSNGQCTLDGEKMCPYHTSRST